MTQDAVIKLCKALPLSPKVAVLEVREYLVSGKASSERCGKLSVIGLGFSLTEGLVSNLLSSKTELFEEFEDMINCVR